MVSLVIIPKFLAIHCFSMRLSDEVKKKYKDYLKSICKTRTYNTYICICEIKD